MAADPRVLTLTQPWASLMASGAKRIETRSWRTRWRGPLVIRAAATFPQETSRAFCAFLCDSDFREALGGRRLEDLPLGAAVAVVRMVGIMATEDVRSSVVLAYEEPFGDFSPGRFAWLTTGLRALREPVPLAGGLGLRRVPEELVEVLGPFV